MRRFIVFDDRILREAPPLVPGWNTEELTKLFGNHPMFHQADSLSQLAGLAGLPAQALSRTVVDYNDHLSTEDPLGRVHRPLPITGPPFYAITVHGLSVTSTVGLAVDRSLRVIRRNGNPIEGLYACGELLGSGQLQGGAFCGGMLLTPALAFGQLLGARLAM